jgi:LAS superfamily LD-carboxypeptidase LdcB
MLTALVKITLPMLAALFLTSTTKRTPTNYAGYGLMSKFYKGEQTVTGYNYEVVFW